MATLEVLVKYQTNLSRIGFWLMMLLSPFWAFFPLMIVIVSLKFPTEFGETVVSILTNVLKIGSFGSAYLGLVGPLGAIAVMVVGVFVTNMLGDRLLLISQQGICFPLPMALALFGRRNRGWHDLESIELRGQPKANNYRGCLLVLRYKSGGSANIRLAEISAEQLEPLLVALETFAEEVPGLETLMPVKKLLNETQRIKGIRTYTNLWEDELRYRYASTTFIPLTPGATLQDAQVKVLRQLGFGGLSAIYLVQHKNRELAILKESVLPGDVDDELKAKAEEQFDREARLLSSLDHPAIAKVLDHFVERGHYLLLEYVHGQDLRQYIKEKGNVAEPVVLDFAVQILEILNYLHSREPAIIHRDLTPENLIVNENGRIVLIDFGAANEFLHTATGTLVGKHAYMAPEQLKGRASAQSDLYSLGGTLYFLLTGKDPMPLMESHPRLVNPGISESLDGLILKLTHLDKSARFGSAMDAKKAVESLLASGVN